MNKLLLIAVSSLTIISSGFSENAAQPQPAQTEAPVAQVTQSTQVCDKAKWVSDKLTSSLSNVLDKSVQVAGDAKDFVVTQLPDVIQQLLKWKMAESFLRFLSGIALLVATGIILRKYLQLGNKLDWDGYENERLIPFGAGTGAITIISVIASSCLINLTWLQIWLAPKVYLIEYVRGMVQK